jgi:hypothetical protein
MEAEMDKKMNNQKMEAVLDRQKRYLTFDKLFALLVALVMTVSVVGLHTASNNGPAVTGMKADVAAQSSPAAADTDVCTPGSALC